MNLDKTVNDDTERLLALIARRGGRLVWTRDRDGRWYQAQILVDLFDTTELRLWWGGPSRSRGGGMTYCLDGLDGDRINALAARLCKRRRQHGYTRLPDAASPGERLQ